MRGAFADQGGLFSYISPEARVPPNHPLRKIRALVRDVLSDLNRSLGRLYASRGASLDPSGAIVERFAAAGILRYSVRTPADGATGLSICCTAGSWGFRPTTRSGTRTSFTKNRDRLQNGEVFTKFMTKLLNHPQVKPLLSDEHFSVDGTLIEAWASQKSFRGLQGRQR